MRTTTQPSTENEKLLADMLLKIINRAARPIKAGTTEIMTQAVPRALLDQASELLASLGR